MYKNILVLGNELDGNKFSTILHCLEQYFCTSDNIELLNNCLKSISQMKRFSIINMFMSSEDKQGIFAMKIILNDIYIIITILLLYSCKKHIQFLRRTWNIRSFIIATNLLHKLNKKNIIHVHILKCFEFCSDISSTNFISSSNNT